MKKLSTIENVLTTDFFIKLPPFNQIFLNMSLETKILNLKLQNCFLNNLTRQLDILSAFNDAWRVTSIKKKEEE